jgi:hypothetical protein
LGLLSITLSYKSPVCLAHTRDFLYFRRIRLATNSHENAQQILRDRPWRRG